MIIRLLPPHTIRINSLLTVNGLTTVRSPLFLTCNIIITIVVETLVIQSTAGIPTIVDGTPLGGCLGLRADLAKDYCNKNDNVSVHLITFCR
jgi:hypothetical protein